MKDFNRIFTRILNNLLTNVQPHGSITKNYYTATLPTNIFVFVKRVVKETLGLNIVEAISMEKDLRSIRFIDDQEDSKDSKDIGKKSQASFTKNKEKDPFEM